MAILMDPGSTEARVLDAIELLDFHPERERERIEVLNDMARTGATHEIRCGAVHGLFMTMSPEAVQSVRASLPDFDDGVRKCVERMMKVPGTAKLESGGRIGRERSPEEIRERRDQKMTKWSGIIFGWQEKLRDQLLRRDLEPGELAFEPTISPDVASGGIGYRIDIVPANEDAAAVLIWMGLSNLRTAVGPRQASQASLSGIWVTPIGRRSKTADVRAYARAARRGAVTEWVDPEGLKSVVSLDLGKGVSEVFKSPSELPDPDQIPGGWTAHEYRGYGSS